MNPVAIKGVSVKGVFGLDARYRHGPLPVVRTAHPATGQFLQLASTAHKLNLLQYQFAPRVAAVLADRQLPPWVGAYLPSQVVHCAQVVELDDGARLIVRLRRAKPGDEPQKTNIQQLRPHLWLIERSSEEVESHGTVNHNLETSGQVLKTHRDEDLSRPSAIVVDALRSSRLATLRQLVAHMQLSLGQQDDLETVARAVVSRLLLEHRLGVNLAEARWSGQSRIVWGGIGPGYIPPMPSGAGGFVLAREAA